MHPHAGRISEDRSNCELIAKEETALQQLLLMALSEQPVVAVQACKTLGALAQLGAATARRWAGTCLPVCMPDSHG
jgi:hypothetical protein